jgi:trimeric autotransporter adhesin
MKKNLLYLLILIFIANTTNAQWSAIGGSLNGSVYGITMRNNELYVGGAFTVPNTIAKWNTSTSAWDQVGTPTIAGLLVSALTTYSGDVYAGGTFNSAGGVTYTTNIAKWNGTAWSAVGAGANGPVKCFAQVGNNLYVGGKFSAVSNTSGQVLNTKCIAKWNGSTWSAVAGGVGTGTEVNAIAAMGGAIYFGGTFTTIGSTPVTVSNIAKWDTLTSTWSAVGNPTGTVNALTVFNGSLYAGGTFGVKKWVPATSSWVMVGTGLTGSATTVNAMINYNGALTVGGFFDGAGSVSGTAKIARWNDSNWYTFNITFTADVDAFYVNPTAQATLYVGGTFTTPYSRIAKYTTMVGVDELSATSSIHVYPNPANDKFTINLGLDLKSSKAEMILYNMIGKQVMQQSIIKDGSIDINCKELPAGIYFVKMTEGNQSSTHKVVISH